MVCRAITRERLLLTELTDAIGFMHRNAWDTSFVSDTFTLSLTSAFGQLFVLITIQRFGPLAFAAIATIRQLGSAVISIVAFKHSPLGADPRAFISLRVFGGDRTV